MPLGWRVGIATGIAVTIAMGPVAIFQGSLARDAAMAERTQTLRLVAAPLVTDLEHAGGPAEVQMALARFRQAFVHRGLPVPEVELEPGGPDPGDDPPASLSLPVSVASLAGGRGTLRLTMPASLMVRRDREALAGWALHLLATLTVVITFLLVVLRYLVVRPLARLVDAARKMEMGYWHAVRDPGGAWEVRWLAWRFSEMGRQLDLAVKNLVHAERAGALAAPSSPEDAPDCDACESAAPTTEASADTQNAHYDAAADAVDVANARAQRREQDAVLRRLRGVSERLAHGLAAGTPDLKLARVTWDEHASEAERRGDMGLAALLEDLAFRTLHPDTYAELELSLHLGRERRSLWVKLQGRALERLLEDAGCPALTVKHRVKSTASVYRKMQAKGLELDEVHDLFAFRVVVPREQDCYLALGVIHRSFEPLLGRFSDYIASPKPSGYQSLHTIVRPLDPGAPIFEIQIRSEAMHTLAESGSAAHWRYKREPITHAELDL
ncbi:MAG: bifunctional (p)ppGpp synthetase/guanosine-3',5'-bis(diphosphate) 3'-pyrophosphohydrolase [Deltaproteobacteria bacterium]|nr:bifunctional (p)ppGpp synthetase/guanosine-3',5'-bis(diphosphate) 3'-pyrophosphohydrolase [Deltaproteobacteria bacterium]